jgi:hypothetical protein
LANLENRANRHSIQIPQPSVLVYNHSVHLKLMFEMRQLSCTIRNVEPLRGSFLSVNFGF